MLNLYQNVKTQSGDERKHSLGVGVKAQYTLLVATKAGLCYSDVTKSSYKYDL